MQQTHLPTPILQLIDIYEPAEHIEKKMNENLESKRKEISYIQRLQTYDSIHI